jgi:hypothetical protein
MADGATIRPWLTGLSGQPLSVTFGYIESVVRKKTATMKSRKNEVHEIQNVFSTPSGGSLSSVSTAIAMPLAWRRIPHPTPG